MKKVFMALSMFTLIIAQDEAVNPESDIDVVSVQSRRKMAAQALMHITFKNIDPEVKERCINQWSESSACNELRDVLLAYVLTERYVCDLFQETLNQSKDKYLHENSGENA